MAREKNKWVINRQVNTAFSNNKIMSDIQGSILNIRIFIFHSWFCYVLLLSHLLLSQSYFFTAEARNFQICLCNLSVNNVYTLIDLSGIDIS